MVVSKVVVALAILGGVSATQFPLVKQPDTHPPHHPHDPHDPFPGPEPSPGPGPWPEPKFELVNSTKIQKLISPDALLQRAKELYHIAERSIDDYGHPTRVIGSPGHRGTLDYIYETIAGLDDYYELYTQTFPATSGKVYESRLVIGTTVPESAQAMSLTPPTRENEPVYGQLILVDKMGCDPWNYPANLTGNIALIKRGTCPFGTKSELAGKAGAVAAVVYNNENGTLSGTLGAPSKWHVATFGLSDTDAAPFIQQLHNGTKVDSIAYMNSVVNTIKTTNIIAQTTEGDPNNCVMLGAHSDSVEAGPGINDDGSGTLSLLEVAIKLTDFRVKNCVRFAWWAAEEEGLLGSNHYVSSLSPEENLKIRLFMDYDMMAGPNFAYQIYNATNSANPNGSQELRELYVNFYKSNGQNYTFIPFDGRSDYDAFIKNGIPGGGIATGAEVLKTKKEQQKFGGKAGVAFDPCYHQLCDDVGNVNVTAWLWSTRLIAHSVAAYAASFEGFPERSLPNPKALAAAKPSKYLGHQLQM